MLSNVIKKLPFIRPLVEERDKLHNLVTAWKRHLRYLPPRHFYSPILNLDEVRENEVSIFGSTPKIIPGKDLAEGPEAEHEGRVVVAVEGQALRPGQKGKKTEGLGAQQEK